MVTDPAQRPLPGFGVAEPPVTPRPSRIGRVNVEYGATRDVLTKATGFMDEYDFTLNPYSGCSFGCTYCYAAFFSKTKEQRDRWGYWVMVKENALELLERRKRGALDGKLIYMSTVTDPYQPIERQLDLTRGLLEVLADRHSPKLVVQTRSPDVIRDCDLFRKIEKRGGRVQVNMTVTTDDEDIRRAFEPFCPSNAVRLHAISEVQTEDVDSCITMTPLLWLNEPYAFADHLLETNVEKFIVQPFHFQRGKFVAGTRKAAVDMMIEKLGCDEASFRERYIEDYERSLGALDRALPELGQGKDGFRPPF